MYRSNSVVLVAVVGFSLAAFGAQQGTALANIQSDGSGSTSPIRAFAVFTGARDPELVRIDNARPAGRDVQASESSLKQYSTDGPRSGGLAVARKSATVHLSHGGYSVSCSLLYGGGKVACLQPIW